ncbi:hypothetical protein VNO78_15935 [Psophocarpus tetragonolobus]|uniref:Uncharacterized protein n=1 Tax=Psophocarpus tetragonolobus TaxID=3891 RepID=A0AAN9XKC2_PSOTE
MDIDILNRVAASFLKQLKISNIGDALAVPEVAQPETTTTDNVHENQEKFSTKGEGRQSLGKYCQRDLLKRKPLEIKFLNFQQWKEAMQRRKADYKNMTEEAEAKLIVEAIRKKEAKEHARQMKPGYF